MTQVSPLFDWALLRRRLTQPMPSALQYLAAYSAENIIERLGLLRGPFHQVLILGACGSILKKAVHHLWPDAVVEILSPRQTLDFFQENIANKTYDLVIFNQGLQFANAPERLLEDLYKLLQPGSPLFVAMLGGKTLQELRYAFYLADMDYAQGVRMRVHPTLDATALTGLAPAVGLKDVTLDSEILTVTYRDLFHYMQELKGMGASNCLYQRGAGLTTPRLMHAASTYYQQDYSRNGRIYATFEYLYLTGWRLQA